VVMVSEVKAAGTPDAGKPASDWDNRRLCSDENCIGVIGRDGRCKECGRPYAEDAGDVPPAAVVAAPAVASEIPLEAPTVVAEADDDWENRRLCSDENCIGVIGRDGRCKECGRPFSG
jgi:hypothetical protein